MRTVNFSLRAGLNKYYGRLNWSIFAFIPNYLSPLSMAWPFVFREGALQLCAGGLHISALRICPQ